MVSKRDRDRGELDKRIIEEVRQWPRTEGELVVELGETESQIRSRLQFLDGAGYVAKNEETGAYTFRADPEESSIFDEHPRLQWVAFGAVLLVSEAIFFYFLDVVIENTLVGIVPPIVALAFSIPLAWMTARFVVSPRVMDPGPSYWEPPQY